MVPAFVVFVFVTGAVLGLYLVARALAAWMSTRRVEQRLREVSSPVDESESTTTVLMRATEGPLPIVERLVAGTQAGSRLARLIEQSGVATTPGAVAAMCITAGLVGVL